MPPLNNHGTHGATAGEAARPLGAINHQRPMRTIRQALRREPDSSDQTPVAAAVAGGTGVSLTTAALFIRTTRIGNFEVWPRSSTVCGCAGMKR